ncbi:ABC transporter ATP-binding protein (plasmid) [Agrobacterium tumefaciens]|uniref:iron ABC transporter ATP-binding protein n=1 Tax=Agrobacterium tumefaciens TaxID=358 RepID=UPI0021CF3FCB|nr:ABC transporter ATP-binding protein [Agrobacterium tumefaciens]NTZ63486.1 ABC transporter ATP-binding protein [Agrobacterium tumefaciens]UXT00180.1 ABC transporter ATP-binding protein [Agrobacterium tumefaciens]UXT52880.1 ABC transporter ATP-binding protein [Agrobacterium tumefaciens]UXT68941.1 ABC transporter ATP-binding protein [Agrobacterium tumefaciens]
MIEIRDVTKSYGETTVVKGVSLTLPRGGVTSIIGPNGAGKSTLLSMIARLIPADSGAIQVDGLDISNTSGEVLAKRLSILRQDNHMTARLTVRDLVSFGRYPYSKGRLTIEDRAHITRALSYLGLEDLGDRFLDELSGGQRQRAFVAMIICQDTDYMLFDEPLNNLDIRHAVSMMKLVRRAATDFAKTAVIVLHDINFASCYSDYIIAMRDGKVLLQGPPAEIIRPEELKRIYDFDFSVHEMGGNRIAAYYS